MCCILSFGWFPGLWSSYGDVSEQSVCSIFIGRLNKKLFKRYMKIEQANRFETSAYKFQRPGNHPKDRIQQLHNDQSLKSRVFFRVHNRCSKIPPYRNAPATRSQISRVIRLSRCSRSFMRAADSKMRSSNSSLVSTFLL